METPAFRGLKLPEYLQLRVAGYTSVYQSSPVTITEFWVLGTSLKLPEFLTFELYGNKLRILKRKPLPQFPTVLFSCWFLPGWEIDFSKPYHTEDQPLMEEVFALLECIDFFKLLKSGFEIKSINPHHTYLGLASSDLTRVLNSRGLVVARAPVTDDLIKSCLCSVLEEDTLTTLIVSQENVFAKYWRAFFRESLKISIHPTRILNKDEIERIRFFLYFVKILSITDLTKISLARDRFVYWAQIDNPVQFSTADWIVQIQPDYVDYRLFLSNWVLIIWTENNGRGPTNYSIYKHLKQENAFQKLEIEVDWKIIWCSLESWFLVIKYRSQSSKTLYRVVDPQDGTAKIIKWERDFQHASIIEWVLLVKWEKGSGLYDLYDWTEIEIPTGFNVEYNVNNVDRLEFSYVWWIPQNWITLIHFTWWKILSYFGPFDSKVLTVFR